MATLITNTRKEVRNARRGKVRLRERQVGSKVRIYVRNRIGRQARGLLHHLLGLFPLLYVAADKRYFFHLFLQIPDEFCLKSVTKIQEIILYLQRNNKKLPSDMAESTIITGQFVRISQTPASIGERFLALLIDYILIGLYLYSTATLIIWSRMSSDFMTIVFFAVTYLPVLFYAFLSILLTKNSQRLGDLAAGTMVIKENNYRKIHVSLDEFDYLTQSYRPTYPQAADLSLEQVNVITRTLQSGKKDRTQRIAQLARKVQELLSVTPRENSQEHFLQTVLRDYQYYALEEL